MCNITLLDSNLNVLNHRDIRIITTINSLLGNFDGFGYYLFNSNELVKTKDETSIYWRNNFDKFKENDSINGIYHVRKSSTYTINNIAVTSDEKSHPFIYNDIVVAHNGCFNFRYTHKDSDKFEKLIGGDLIDSQKFARVLGEVCEKGKVTFDNIKYALNLFGGAYALAIKGIQDDFAWLIRGKDRTLVSLTILQNEKPISLLVNTTSLSPLLLGELLLDYDDYDYSCKELKENTAYKYNLNSYLLEEAGEIKQDSVFESINKPVVVYGGFKNNYKDDSFISTTIYEDTLTLMYKMGLYVQDLVILSELVLNKPLFILEEVDFKNLKDFLSKLSFEAHDSRLRLWQDIQKVKDGSFNKLYNSENLQYPFFLNSKDELKSFLHKLNEKGKVKHESITIQ